MTEKIKEKIKELISKNIRGLLGRPTVSVSADIDDPTLLNMTFEFPFPPRVYIGVYSIDKEEDDGMITNPLTGRESWL